MTHEISTNKKPGRSEAANSDTFEVNAVLNSDAMSADTFIGAGDAVDVLAEKLTDAMIPGAMVEFDPEEAERAGAFIEDALTEADALESDIDLMGNE